LSTSLVLQRDRDSSVNVALDMAALSGLLKLPAANGQNNSSSDPRGSVVNTSSLVTTLTFSNLTLINLPPGPPSSYPLGMSALMMWSIDMDR
jgi:hypothetical protein